MRERARREPREPRPPPPPAPGEAREAPFPLLAEAPNRRRGRADSFRPPPQPGRHGAAVDAAEGVGRGGEGDGGPAREGGGPAHGGGGQGEARGEAGRRCGRRRGERRGGEGGHRGGGGEMALGPRGREEEEIGERAKPTLLPFILFFFSLFIFYNAFVTVKIAGGPRHGGGGFRGDEGATQTRIANIV